MTTTTDEKALVPFNTMRDFIYKNQKTLAMMMPKILNGDRFIRVAINEVMKNPKLAECAPATVMGALMQCAQFGLEPNSVLGHAYLIPFRNNKKNRMECQLIPGYKGLIELARRSGQISVIDAHEVLEGDDFDYAYGTDPWLKHKPAKTGRGKITDFYAVGKMKDGSVQFTVMSIEDMRDHRDRFSRAADEGPWKDNFDEMGKKTVLRKLCKYLPASIELQKAVMLDELAESNVSQNLSVLAIEQGVIPAEAETPEAANGSAPDRTDEEMEAVQAALKQANAATVPEAEKEPTETGGVDDETWTLFIEYLDEDKERVKLKQTVKEKMLLGNLRVLKGNDRRTFILSMQDAAKKAKLPFQVWVKE